ncbi:MAG: AAA family ATPase [Proteobacteria bacterium]|nr:AAA family ATPase [Pseudomonadota bacterium]
MSASLAEVAQAKLDAQARARATNVASAQPRFEVLDAAALLKQEIKPVNYCVPGWIPEGLLVLAAAPKVGKSTLILQIAVCKAAGLPFWGADVPKGKVLMIDLETNERRLRRKLESAGATSLEPGRLLYATDWPRGMAGINRIAELLDAEPEISLVIVDTLQRFRDSSKGGQNAYAADYDAMAPLQKLCRDRSGLAIVVVHHKRKAASDDPIDSLNGSAAIAGAADGIWIITRKGGDYILNVQARDWERDEDEFRIERDAGQWRLVNGPRFTPNEAAVLKLLEVGGGMTGPQLGEALGVHRTSAHERLKRMQARGLILFRDGAWQISV